tara:strand:- start:13462 stop:14682 length:1221 start_codon:yes stop_codon:yes gene_type:complete
MTKKKLTLKQQAILAPIKKAIVSEQVVVKEKEIVAEQAEIKYAVTKKDAVSLKQNKKALVNIAKATTSYKNEFAIQQLVSKGSVEQEDLTKLGIYQPAKSTTINDIKKILEKREVVSATKIVDFDLNYNIELIPLPDNNKIYSLSTIENNVFDVPVYGPNIDTGDLEVQHVLKNYIVGGGQYRVSVSGVHGTQYELVVVDETGEKYYNFNGDGSFQHGFSYYQGVIPEKGRDVVSISLPESTTENIYRLGFAPASKRRLSTNYSGLPIFGDITKPMYKITQLPQASTTIMFEYSELGTGAGDLVINHTPGSKLNSSHATAGKYDVELTISPRKEIQLGETILNGKLSMEFIDLGEAGEGTEILKMDLNASIKNNIGTVKGTITLGKASLRKSFINIRAADIFSTLN